jgi:hypothetical protein
LNLFSIIFSSINSIIFSYKYFHCIKIVLTLTIFKFYNCDRQKHILNLFIKIILVDRNPKGGGGFDSTTMIDVTRGIRNYSRPNTKRWRAACFPKWQVVQWAGCLGTIHSYRLPWHFTGRPMLIHRIFALVLSIISYIVLFRLP